MTADVNGVPEIKRPSPPPKKGGWIAVLKPYLAPILISCILAAGSAQYGALEGNWGTFWAIITSILGEMAMSLFVSGRLPHFASAYITGISVGILLRTPLVWPYIMCSLLSITSKYALRVKGRHLWNPSNLGVSILLFVVPEYVAPLSQQLGNEIYVLLIIGAFGMLILYTLGRLHITLTYIISFLLLSFVRVGVRRDDWMVVRSVFTDETAFNLWIYEVALLTAPAYLLFMFFMITDPKTTPLTKPRQIVVTIVVAIVETLLRLGREIHAPYYALFIVFPVTNMLEIVWDAIHPKPAKAMPVPPVVAPALETGIIAADQATGIAAQRPAS